MPPVDPVVGKGAIKHVLFAIKKGIEGTAAVICDILYGKEREKYQRIYDLGTRELAVWVSFVIFAVI